MKLSNNTINILKNFSTINSGIYIKEGNVLSTVSLQKNILADAVIEETFPQSFGIYDLHNFLSVLSLFKDQCELEFDENHVIVTGMGGRSRIKYRFTPENMVVSPPEKRPNLPSVDVNFELTNVDFNWILRSASVLGVPHIAVVGDEDSVKLVAFDAFNDSAHVNSLDLPNVFSEGKNFKLVFRAENLKMIPSNYDVKICSKGVSVFSDNTNKITYYVTIETCSTYE